ncbi:hypothetical protein FQN54_004895 [Arachnomyces sp. PD_36]|nr:hypothetical protein FQN54_004895 [Arachnomyces sp. PD_36]
MCALSYAASNGDSQITLILMDAALKSLQSDRGILLQPLCSAAAAGQLTIVQIFLTAGADPAMLALPDFSTYGAELPEALASHEKIARILIEAGAPISQRDPWGRTALHFAAMKGNETMVRLLLDLGIDISVADAIGQTEICFASTMAVDIGALLFDEAAHSGHEAVLKLLVDRGVELSAADRNGATALHRLCSKTGTIYESMVQTLVSAGADVSAATADGITPLYLAAAEGSQTMVETLVNAGARPLIPSHDNFIDLKTPLEIGVEKGHEEVVRILLETLGDLPLSTLHNYKQKLLRSACSKGHEGIALLLLNAGADPQSINEDGSNTLHDATAQGLERLAKNCISMGVDVSAQDSYGVTPLFVAAFHDQLTIAQLLVDAGADICTPDEGGRTPLHVAVENDCFSVVELLLDAGAPVSAQNSFGQAPLHLAKAEVMPLLLRAGADVSMTDEKGRTALHLAVGTAIDESTVNLLLSNGAKTSAVDSNGSTALHYAANGDDPYESMYGEKYSPLLYDRSKIWQQQVAVARLLLRAGGDATFVNKDGETALDLARKMGNETLIEMLNSK